MIFEIGHEMLWGERPSDACQGKSRKVKELLNKYREYGSPSSGIYHRVVWEWVVRCARHRAVAHCPCGVRKIIHNAISMSPCAGKFGVEQPALRAWSWPGRLSWRARHCCVRSWPCVHHVHGPPQSICFTQWKVKTAGRR